MQKEVTYFMPTKANMFSIRQAWPWEVKSKNSNIWWKKNNNSFIGICPTSTASLYMHIHMEKEKNGMSVSFWKKKRMFKKGLYDCKPYRISCSDSSIHKNWHTYFRGNIQHKEEKYLQAKEKVDNDYTAMYSLWNSWATSLKKRI